MLCSNAYSDVAGRVHADGTDSASPARHLHTAKRALQARWTQEERMLRRELAVARQRELFDRLFGARMPHLAAS